MNQHRIELVQAGDKQFKLLCYMLSDPSAAPEEVPLTDDYQLQPPLAEAVAREAFTIKADNQSVKEVVAEGAFGGEDALLYNFQLKRDQVGSPGAARAPAACCHARCWHAPDTHARPRHSPA